MVVKTISWQEIRLKIFLNPQKTMINIFLQTRIVCRSRKVPFSWGNVSIKKHASFKKHAVSCVCFIFVETQGAGWTAASPPPAPVTRPDQLSFSLKLRELKETVNIDGVQMNRFHLHIIP